MVAEARCVPSPRIVNLLPCKPKCTTPRSRGPPVEQVAHRNAGPAEATDLGSFRRAVELLPYPGDAGEGRHNLPSNGDVTLVSPVSKPWNNPATHEHWSGIGADLGTYSLNGPSRTVLSINQWIWLDMLIWII